MSASLSLYEIEDHLAALLDTVEMVPEEQAPEIEAEIGEWVTKAVDKRDRVGQFLAHCEGQCANIDEEIDRLRALKTHYSNAHDRVSDAVVRAIISIGPDDKGKYKRLEGKTCSLGIRSSQAIEITDAVELQAAGYVRTKMVQESDKKRAGEDMKSGFEVPGAHLITRYSLVRK